MKRIERIKQILKKNLKPDFMVLEDNSKKHIGHNEFDGKDETHLYLKIASKSFNNINLINVHKKINSLIESEYKNGLHSLEIKIIKS